MSEVPSHSLDESLIAAEELTKHGDVRGALVLYSAAQRSDPAHPRAYQRSAQLLLGLGRHSEAEAVLHEAVRLCAADKATYVDYARLAMFARDWPRAFARWTTVLTNFPDVPAGYSGVAMALRELGRLDDAEAVVSKGLKRFPRDPDILIENAVLSHSRQCWEEAASKWAEVRLHAPSRWQGNTAGARAAVQLRDYATAEHLLKDAVERFPEEPEPWHELARLSAMREEWSLAEASWKRLEKLRPKSIEAKIGQAQALRNLGRPHEAEALLESEIALQPDEPALLEEHANTAVAREDWGQAISRLSKAQRRFPSVNSLSQRLFEVKLRVADIDPTLLTSYAGNSESENKTREVVMQFESLGGMGHGCEFGIFQRYFGAEPLGLLRWADLSHDLLSLALETEFEGVGSPEQTILFVPDSGERPEYWTRDAKFHMAMRSFVHVEEVAEDRMRRRVTQRLRFLRDKLIDDLKAGTKLFVFKNLRRNLTEDELTRLHAGVRRYGDNTLFYVRYADESHPAGLVEVAGSGLLIGYIERFTNHPETDEYLGPSAEFFRSLCETALPIWRSGATQHVA